MTVKELAKLINGDILTKAGADNDVKCGCTCDLLSFVMDRGRDGCAWITVQTHMNVVAVASLHDMSAIIWCEGVKADTASVAKASEEGIAVISSPMSAYSICGLMCGNGIPDTGKD